MSSEREVKMNMWDEEGGRARGREGVGRLTKVQRFMFHVFFLIQVDAVVSFEFPPRRRTNFSSHSQFFPQWAGCYSYANGPTCVYCIVGERT